MKFLFLSGFTENVPESRTSTLLAWDFLAKPYAPVDLCERIHKLLGASVELVGEAKSPKRVLVVDDERPIRRFFQEVLENAGYGVVTAENGKDATRCLREDEGIDIVLTDLVMPEMEGIEFISAVRKSRPDLKIVATTGGQHTVYLQGAAMLGAAATLTKPVAPDALLSCLQSLS
jgi:CheY-like chemotaxis protein